MKMKKALAAALALITANALSIQALWAASDFEGLGDTEGLESFENMESEASDVPVITANPQSATKHMGDGSTTLSVTAAAPNGSALDYEWLISETGSESDLVSAPWHEGNSGSTYTAEEKEGAVYYACRVHNTLTGEYATSAMAKVEYLPKGALGEEAAAAAKPSVYYAHTMIDLVEGESFTVEASVSNRSQLPAGAKLSYQWYEGSSSSAAKISGASSVKLSKTLSSESTHYYFMEASYVDPLTNEAVSSRSPDMQRVKVTVSKPAVADPLITKQPVSSQANQGDSLTLSIEASSPDGGSIKCSWYWSTDNAYNGVKASDGENPFCLADTSKMGSAYYYCEVANYHADGAFSVLKSDIIKVTVAPSENAPIPAAISLSRQGTLKPGETVQLALSGTIEDAPQSWSVDFESLGSVDGNGLFTALKDGPVTVTATLSDGQTLTTAITVSDPNASSTIKPWMWSIPTVISAAGVGMVIHIFLLRLKFRLEDGEEGAFPAEGEA
jgi:hypothetical protein